MKHAANSTTGPGLIEITLCEKQLCVRTYVRRHFQIPSTSHGYLYVLLSSKDNEYKTFYLSETEMSLSDELSRFNSTDFIHNSYINENQPWAAGFVYWNLKQLRARKRLRVNEFLYEEESWIKYKDLLAGFQAELKLFPHLLHAVCGTLTKR